MAFGDYNIFLAYSDIETNTLKLKRFDVGNLALNIGEEVEPYGVNKGQCNVDYGCTGFNIEKINNDITIDNSNNVGKYNSMGYTLN